MPFSVSLDSGIQGRVFLGGQPEWIHKDPSKEGQELTVQTKACIPLQSGLVDLGVANHVESIPLQGIFLILYLSSFNYDLNDKT